MLVFGCLGSVDYTIQCKSGVSIQTCLGRLVAVDLILLLAYARCLGFVLAYTSANAASFGEEVGRAKFGKSWR